MSRMRNWIGLVLLSASMVPGVRSHAELLTYRYDGLGRLVKACQVGGGNLTSYTLDAADNRQSYSSSLMSFVLNPWSGIYSADGRFYFVMQSDGNLVLYMNFNTSSQTALWASATTGTGATFATFQGDGNLVLYTSSIVPKWASNTGQNYCARLDVQNDGNVVISNIDGIPIWATGTGGH